ncbi:MAG: glycosyltransferase family 39 protein [Verrucomicrobiia bacterium]
MNALGMCHLLSWLNPWKHRARAVCFALAFLFLAIAFLGPKPWDAARLDRIESGRTLRPIDHAAGVLMPTALGAAAIALFVGSLSGMWAGERAQTGLDNKGEGGVSSDRRTMPLWFLIGLILAASLALAIRIPLATKSLWWDEIWTLKHAVSGYWTEDQNAEGGMRFLARDWPRTVWYYGKPTNHVGFSVLSRGSLEAWRAITGAERHAFKEWVIRLPSLVASVGAVIVVGIIGKMILGAPAGLLAALLLGIHPWFVRYGVEARGFGLNVFFAAWFALCWLQIMRGRASWSWVVGLGVSAAALVLTFPYNLFLPLSGFVTLVLAALFLRQPGMWVACRRAVASLVLAGLCVALVAAPWVPQALEWTDVQGEAMAGPRLDRDGMIQVWTSFLIGLPVHAGHGVEAEGIPDLTGALEKHPWLGIFVWGLLPLAVCRAFCRCANLRRTHARCDVADLGSSGSHCRADETALLLRSLPDLRPPGRASRAFRCIGLGRATWWEPHPTGATS